MAKVFCVRDAVYGFLREAGIRHVFGNPGSTELPFFRDFPSDFSYVLGLHESIVVGMADGHAQASRRPSFVNLHSAAGVGNAMGAIFTAFKNHTPMVITAGQQARSMLPYDPFLYSERATELPRPYVKWAAEPARAEDVPRAIARAYHVAMMPPRGPVLVSVPADDWDRPAEPVPLRAVSQAVRPDAGLLGRMAEGMGACERPAIVVGDAVDRAGAWEAVLDLAGRQRARVYAAPMSGRCSFPEDHPLFGGTLPAMRDALRRQLAGHDAVLVLGAPAFTYHVEGEGPFVEPGTALFLIVDEPDTAAWAPVGLAAVGSLRESVQELAALSPHSARALPPPRAPVPAAAPPHAGERMSIAYVLQTLSEIRRRDDVILEEAASARPVLQRYLPIYESHGYYACSSGGLGFGMAAAVGLAMGNRDRHVIGVVGDGSSMYAFQALWTAAQLRLPLTLIILRNRRYAALEHFAPVFGFAEGERVPGTALPGLDFVKLAQAMDCDARRIGGETDLRAALDAAIGSARRAERPLVLEIEVA